MKIGALYLGFWRISWHWKWSLTWRWILSINRHDSTVKMGYHEISTYCGEGALIVFNTRLIDIALHIQPNMHRHTVRLELKYQRVLDRLTGYVDD